jgi:sugar/nucleoside kinase (ribokinase family)
VPSMSPDFDIVFIGNFAKDKIIIDGVEETASGGGVYYGSAAVRRLGLRTAVVTRLHPDDFPRLEELRAIGVDVHAIAAQGTSGIANTYASSNMETRICKPIGFGGKYEIKDIPPLSCRVIMLSPLFAGEVDLPFLQAMAQRAPLAMDIQGFVRVPVGDDLVFKPWNEMAEGLKTITFLKVDKAEAEFLTGKTDLEAAARQLQAYGPKEIVVTQNAGVKVLAEGKFHFAPFNPRSLVGRTGRGDTCFSVYSAKRLDGSAEEACRWAAAVTSRKLEVKGPWQGDASEIERQLSGR